MEHIWGLLEAIGFSNEQITKLKELKPETGKELEAIAPFKTDFEAKIKKYYQSDAAFIKQLRDTAKAETYKKVSGIVKDLYGLSDEQVKDAKIEDIMSLAKSAIEATAKGDSTEHIKTINELKKLNLELSGKVKNLEETEIPKIRTEAQTELLNTRIRLDLEKMVRSNKLAVADKYSVPGLINDLIQNHSFGYSDAGELIVKAKDGSDLLDAKTKAPVQIGEYVLAKGIESGIIAQSNGGEPNTNPASGNPNPKPASGKPMTQAERNIQRAREAVEAQKKAQAKASGVVL